MPVDKFSISLPEALVVSVDEIAAEEGSSRSAVIREAAAAYVSAREVSKRESERAKRIDAALDGFDAVSQSWGADDRTGLDYVTELRGEAPRVSGPEVASGDD